MFIKEREYLDKLETAIDKLDSLDYNKLSDIKSVSTKEGSDVDVAIEQENEWWK